MAGLTSSNRNQFPLSTVELCWPVLGTSLTVGWQLLETKFGDCCDKLGWASTDRHATSLLMSLPPLVVGGGVNLKVSELICPSHELSEPRLEEQ